MTQRDYHEAVKANNITEEVIAFADNELKKLDERNAKRAEKNAEKRKENEPLKEKILAMLTSEPQVTTVIAEAIGLSVPKTSPLCRELVSEGKAVAHDVKVPKKGKQKGYALA